LTAGTLPQGPAGKNVRANFLHRSRDLEHWEYRHPFLEDDHYSLVGDDGACPYFWPIGDRHILLHFSHYSGGRYLLGDYDTAREKLVVAAGGRFTFGPVAPGGVHAPSAMPDGAGGVIVLHNMNPGKPCEGWNQLMTLPRRLTLRDGDRLGIEPAGDIESVRGEHHGFESLRLDAGEDVGLEGVRGDALEIRAVVQPERDQTIEMDVLRSPDGEERTRIVFYRDRGWSNKEHGTYEPMGSLITIDSTHSSSLPDVRTRAPETAPVLVMPDEALELRVFVDRSIVEVFVNGRQCAAVRVYPGRRDSSGVRLRSLGRSSTVRTAEVWKMQSIYE
jgi:beta-fructofuranosidase